MYNWHMITARSIWLILAAVLYGQLLTATTAFAQLPDGERELVQQLVDRAFFDLAEQFCRQRLEDRADMNVRSEWEFLLSESHQQHAWWLDSNSRVEMIRMAAHRITDFLKSNTPSPENDLMLRVRQIELLASSGTMESVLQASVTNTVRTSTHPPRENPGGLTTTAPPVAGSARTSSVSREFALEAMRQSSELGIALLAQLDELRKDIDRDVARSARDRIRCALADMTFARSRLTSGADSADLRHQADEMAEQLLKSASDDGLRFRARLLLTDIQLDQQDFEAFRLRFTSLKSTADTEAKTTATTAVRIRGLLVQGQPSEALQECLNQTKGGVSPTQELRALRLQGLLQLLELLSQLDPALPQTLELRTKTIDEFALLKEKALAMTRGVWRERCLKIASRFERVQQVGPEAAAELDEVFALAETGDIREARETLLRLSGRTTRQSPAVTATFLLQSGDFAVRLSAWSEAIDDLTRSRDLFHDSGDMAREAAADLLRVFAIGRQWNSAGIDPASEAAYREALDAHIQSYARQTTVAKAREWRARLLRTTDPLHAAEELLDVVAAMNPVSAASLTDPANEAERLNVLSLAGDCLLEAVHRPARTATDVAFVSHLSVLAKKFAEQSNVSEELASASSSPTGNLLKAQRLCFSCIDKMSAGIDWNTLQTDSSLLLPVLTGILESTAVTSTQDKPRSNHPAVQPARALIQRSLSACQEMHVLSSLRQLASANSFADSRAALESQSLHERLNTAGFLARQLSTGSAALPGDPQLAKFLVRLLESPALEPVATLTIDQEIDAVEILKRACIVSGQLDVFEKRLNDLMVVSLSDEQLRRIGALVSGGATAEVAASPDAGRTRRFWQSVQKRSRAGDDAWFEATLQMAFEAEKSGDRKAAVRILTTVSVLHPGWGTNERQARAEELKQRLETVP